MFGTDVLHRQDLTIRQGADCTWALRYSEKDDQGQTVTNSFAGWSARSQIRNRVGGDIWLTQTVTVTPADNKLTIYGHISAAITEAPAWNSRNAGVWDVELVRADGSVIPLVGGQVFISHDVTRL